MAEAITTGNDVNVDGTDFPKVQLKQQQANWQSETFSQSLGGIGTISGTPSVGGTAWVSY